MPRSTYTLVFLLTLATPASALPGDRERAGGCSIPIEQIYPSLVKRAGIGCKIEIWKRDSLWWAAANCGNRKQLAFAMSPACAVQLSIENWLNVDWGKRP